MAKKGPLIIEGISTFIILFILLLISIFTIVGAYSGLGWLLAVVLSIGAIFLVWKIIRLKRNLEESKKAVNFLIIFWFAISIIALALFYLNLWLIVYYDMGINPLVDCYESYEPSGSSNFHIDIDPCYWERMIVNLYSYFIFVSIMHVPFLVLVRFIGPLFERQ